MEVADEVDAAEVAVVTAGGRMEDVEEAVVGRRWMVENSEGGGPPSMEI